MIISVWIERYLLLYGEILLQSNFCFIKFIHRQELMWAPAIVK